MAVEQQKPSPKTRKVGQNYLWSDGFSQAYNYVGTFMRYYSRTSEQRTLWERVFCGGCPYLGGSPRDMSTMFKLLWMKYIYA